HHDVVLDQPALVAAGYRDRRVAIVEAHREVAAGRRCPAGGRQLADVADDLARAVFQPLAIVGEGFHGASLSKPARSAVPTARRARRAGQDVRAARSAIPPAPEGGTARAAASARP